MSWQYSCKFQTPATFHDVAACFSEEEWKLLQDWQKELYNNVMKDIQQALISLGPLIAASVFSLRAKENVEQFHINPPDSQKRHSISHSPSDQGMTSVVSFTVKSEDETNFDEDLDAGRESQGGDMDREMEAVDFVQFVQKASSSPIKNTQTCIQSSDNSANNGCKQWLESNQDLEREKTTQSEIISKVPEHNIVHHGFSKAVDGVQDYERESTLKNECQAIMLQSSDRCMYGDCEKNRCDEIDSPGHKRTYTGQRFYQCTECEKAFSQKVYLQQHQRTHLTERTYQHTKGEKAMHQKRELFAHHQTETGESMYQCCECGKSFLRKNNFVRHQKAHLGERPYLCTECGKRFTQKINLIRHCKIHTGERPYHCTVCGKRFITKIHLVRHLKTHE